MCEGRECSTTVHTQQPIRSPPTAQQAGCTRVRTHRLCSHTVVLVTNCSRVRQCGWQTHMTTTPCRLQTNHGVVRALSQCKLSTTRALSNLLTNNHKYRLLQKMKCTHIHTTGANTHTLLKPPLFSGPAAKTKTPSTLPHSAVMSSLTDGLTHVWVCWQLVVCVCPCCASAAHLHSNKTHDI